MTTNKTIFSFLVVAMIATSVSHVQSAIAFDTKKYNSADLAAFGFRGPVKESRNTIISLIKTPYLIFDLECFRSYYEKGYYYYLYPQYYALSPRWSNATFNEQGE